MIRITLTVSLTMYIRCLSLKLGVNIKYRKYLFKNRVYFHSTVPSPQFFIEKTWLKEICVRCFFYQRSGAIKYFTDIKLNIIKLTIDILLSLHKREDLTRINMIHRIGESTKLSSLTPWLCDIHTDIHSDREAYR